MAKTKKENIQKEFVALDLLGEEVFAGDTITMAVGSGYSSYLGIGIIKEIKLCPKSVRIYYKRVGESYDRDTYINLDYSVSNQPSWFFLKLKNIEFNLDQNRFKNLFAEKIKFVADSNS